MCESDHRILQALAGALRLLICGDVPDAVKGLAQSYKERIKRRIDQAGLGELVEWLGHIPEEKVAELFSRAAALVVPYEAGPTISTSGVIIRAMVYGVPVIASAVRGFTDEIKDGETGLLFREKDAAELADKIRELIGDDQLAEKLGKNAYDHVAKEHSWQNVARLVNRHDEALK